VIWAEDLSVPRNNIAKNGSSCKKIPNISPTQQVRRPENVRQREALNVILPQSLARGRTRLAEQLDRLIVALRPY
jgi:hypothetical protein